MGPSDQFGCTYGGQFAQTLEINRPLVEQFLAIASLDGRVLLRESTVRRPRTVLDGVNPDGSVTGRRGLRWGEKIETEGTKINPYFQVEPDNAGWVVSVNGDLIFEDLMKKEGANAREVSQAFARKFNWYTRVGLREALLKDKFTSAKDKFITGRLVGSIGMIINCKGLLISSEDVVTNLANHSLQVAAVGLFFLINSLNYLVHRDNKEHEKSDRALYKLWNMNRRTTESKVEIFLLPLEVDRVVAAYGYMDWKKYTGNPVVRKST